MELSPLLLSKLLFYSFILGIALGILNDIWRITRVFFGVRYSSERFERLYSRLKMKREYNSAENKLRQLPLNVIIFLQDLVFMIIAAVGIVFLNYYLNDGEIRLFTVISAVIGCALWYMSFGKLVIMFSEPIVMLIKFINPIQEKLSQYMKDNHNGRKMQITIGAYLETQTPLNAQSSHRSTTSKIRSRMNAPIF